MASGLLSAVLLASLALCPFPAARAAELAAEGPWVREGPPAAPVLAGYLVLRNLGDRPRVLRGASSPDFRRVELHRTVIRDGVAAMEGQDALPVPPGGTLVLDPGGYHLMLVEAQRPLRAGDEVELSLQFADGESLSFRAPVRRDAAGPGGMDHAHHHGPGAEPGERASEPLHPH